MKVGLYDYQGKGTGLGRLIQQAGHQIVTDHPYDLLLVDCDYPWAGDRIALIEQAHDFGALVAVYPHGGEALHFYDGICAPHPDVDAFLVTGPGHRRFQERFGHRLILETGWYWCEQKPFEPRKPERVLFAPLHPWGDGVTIAAAHRDANIQAFDAVCGLGLPVTVRYIGNPDSCGVEPREGVTMVQVGRDLDTRMIDEHDLVVACGTYAALALARGKQVVMFDQEIEPHDDYFTKPVSGWAAWKHETRYPLNVGDAPLYALAARAGNRNGQTWRREFVGPQATVESVTQVMDTIADL